MEHLVLGILIGILASLIVCGVYSDISDARKREARMIEDARFKLLEADLRLRCLANQVNDLRKEETCK